MEVVGLSSVVELIQGKQRPRAKAAKWVEAVASGSTSRKVYLGLNCLLLFGLTRINVTGVVCCKNIILTT